MKFKTKLLVFFLILIGTTSVFLISIPVYLHQPEMQIMLRVRQLYHLDYLVNQQIVDQYGRKPLTETLYYAHHDTRLLSLYQELDSRLSDLKTVMEDDKFPEEKRRGYLVYYDNIALRMGKLDDKFKSAYDFSTTNTTKDDYQTAVDTLIRVKRYGIQEGCLRPCKGASSIRTDIYYLSQFYYELSSYKKVPEVFQIN